MRRKAAPAIDKEHGTTTFNGKTRSVLKADLAKWRELIKPIVLEMHRHDYAKLVISLSDGIAHVDME